MVSLETKIRTAHLMLSAQLFARKKTMDKYGFEQRRSFLRSFINLIEKSEIKSKDAGYNSRMAINLLNYVNPKKTYFFRKKFGFNPPTFFVLNPTNACDKRCYGCYAGELNKKNSLSFEVMDKLLEEAKKSGMNFITISGGEPFFNPNTIKIFEKHKDITFLVYTHGGFLAGGYPEEFIRKNKLLQGEALVRKLAEIGNVHPAISQEGYEKETDARRGKGTYEKILKARELMNKYGIAHGASLTITSLNFERMSDEKFYEDLIKQGCDFIWMFTYIPIGRAPDTKLMVTPRQRFELADLSIRLRDTYKILVGDFRESAGDAQKGSCMIAGRGFFNVDGTGNIAPCTFVPYYIDNVNELYNEFYVKENKKKFNDLIEDARHATPRAKEIILRAYNGLLNNWDYGLRIIPFALSRGMFVEMRLAQEDLLKDKEHGKIHGSCVCSVLDHSKEVLRGPIKKWHAYSTDNQPSLTENSEIMYSLDKKSAEQIKLARHFRKSHFK